MIQDISQHHQQKKEKTRKVIESDIEDLKKEIEE